MLSIYNGGESKLLKISNGGEKVVFGRARSSEYESALVSICSGGESKFCTSLAVERRLR